MIIQLQNYLLQWRRGLRRQSRVRLDCQRVGDQSLIPVRSTERFFLNGFPISLHTNAGKVFISLPEGSAPSSPLPLSCSPSLPEVIPDFCFFFVFCLTSIIYLLYSLLSVYMDPYILHALDVLPICSAIYDTQRGSQSSTNQKNSQYNSSDSYSDSPELGRALLLAPSLNTVLVIVPNWDGHDSSPHLLDSTECASFRVGALQLGQGVNGQYSTPKDGASISFLETTPFVYTWYHGGTLRRLHIWDSLGAPLLVYSRYQPGMLQGHLDCTRAECAGRETLCLLYLQSLRAGIGSHQVSWLKLTADLLTGITEPGWFMLPIMVLRVIGLDSILILCNLRIMDGSPMGQWGGGISTPALYLVDIGRRCIYMEYIENSITVKDYIALLTDENSEEKSMKKKLDHIAQEIGKTLGKMHANNIIHGDLTTSNMLLVDKGDVKVVVMIDFGLSHGEASTMNKGVDLYVLERAILSTHANVESLFPAIIKFYIKANKDAAEVMKKLQELGAERYDGRLLETMDSTTYVCVETHCCYRSEINRGRNFLFSSCCGTKE
uniref:non-specific serine/threonine protein kinase n=1 Tax=Timema cristinae TaxID=61476 RepID=A0A7R9CKG5_TIMCR|nr:unnamed protein product [Timema cristinae]